MWMFVYHAVSDEVSMVEGWDREEPPSPRGWLPPYPIACLPPKQMHQSIKVPSTKRESLRGGMTTETNDSPGSGGKGRTRTREGGVQAAPKQFQKLVIQTLMKKDEESSDSSPSERFELPQFIGTKLDLTKKGLRAFPEELLWQAEFVQYLYLEDNKLTELPETFFQCLTHLKWVDLRNNELVGLPTAGLKNHPYLEFLLLQRNRIKNLPTELGVIPTLKGLQIAGNPIENVPGDVIAEGFHSIMKYLRKVNTQENILLPNSDAIVLKPSTVKALDEQRNPDNGVVPDDTESFNNERNIWNLDPEPYEPLNRKKLLLRSKMCPKPKQRIISSTYVTKRRSRLGYRRKMVTPEMLHEKAKREMQLARKRETLEKQARKIQRMKDRETLKTWRRQTQRNADQLRLLDNYQQYPSRNFAMDTPFDVDPEFLNMLNRTDLYRSLKETEAMEKKRRKGAAKLRITPGELEKQMREITKKLETLNASESDDISPRTKQSHLCNKIAQMKEIQKTLKTLQHRNVSLI